MPSFPLRRILKSHRNLFSFFFLTHYLPIRPFTGKALFVYCMLILPYICTKQMLVHVGYKDFFFSVSRLFVFCQCINFSGSLRKKNKTKKPAHCVCLKKEQFSIILFLVARGIDKGLLQLSSMSIISLFLNSALSINRAACTKSHNCHCRRFRRDGLQGQHGVIAAVPVSAPPRTFPFL